MITIILLELVIVMEGLLKTIPSICNLSIMFKFFVVMMGMVFSIHLLLMRKPIMIMICLLCLMIMVIMIAILLNLLPLQLLGMTMLIWGVILILCMWLMIRMFYVMIILLLLFMMLLETTTREVNIILLVLLHLEILELDLIFCA